VHKGYSTAEHSAALTEHGPSDVHRWSFANVANAAAVHGHSPPHRVMLSAAALETWDASVCAVGGSVGKNSHFAAGALSIPRGGARIS
jgi:ribonuclease HII